MNTHNHNTHEEIRACSLSFGECWKQASKLHAQKEEHKAHNKPKGSHPDDKRNNY